MALIHADELRNIGPQVAVNRENDSVRSREVQNQLMALVEPLFEDIRGRIWTLEREINDAFEETGFTYFEAWEALPHKYVSDSLLPLYTFIEEVKQQIKHGTPEEIIKSLQILVWQARERFKEADEFLAGRLSRMSKEQWLEIHPKFHQEMELPALEDELAWTIGTFVRPSKEFTWKKAVSELEL